MKCHDCDQNADVTVKWPGNENVYCREHALRHFKLRTALGLPVQFETCKEDYQGHKAAFDGQ